MNNYETHFHIRFKNLESTEPLKVYATEKIEHVIKKYIHQDTEVHVVLEVEKKRQIAECTFNCYGSSVVCKEESETMYKSIDALVETIAKQLSRKKEKMTAHHSA